MLKLLYKLSEVASEGLFQISKHFLYRSQSINLPALALLVIVVNNGHSLISEGCKSLLQRLDIVVIASTRLRSLENAADHGILVCVHEEYEGDIY